MRRLRSATVEMTVCPMVSQSLARVRSLLTLRVEKRVGRKLARPPGLLYSVDETPPLPVLIVSGLQQVALMSNSLVYPIILGREAHLSSDRLLDFVSLSMLALGMATLLLCAKGRFIGCGYLCPAAYTQIYLVLPRSFPIRSADRRPAAGVWNDRHRRHPANCHSARVAAGSLSAPVRDSGSCHCRGRLIHCGTRRPLQPWQCREQRDDV